MTGELILTSNTYDQGRISINNSFSGTANLNDLLLNGDFSGGTGGGVIYSAGTNLYNIFSTGSGGTSANLWSASTGIKSIIANNGTGNLASGNYSIVGGGNNSSTGNYSFIGGGQQNLATASGSSVVGGQKNKASGTNSFIGGGYMNSATTVCSSISGGKQNLISANTPYSYGYKSSSFIGSGVKNIAISGYYSGSFIGGGRSNFAGGLYYCSNFIGNGRNNTNTGSYSFIGNGFSNKAYGNTSIILNGRQNTAMTVSSSVLNGDYNISYGLFSTILNGTNNKAISDFSTILGGYNNKLSKAATGSTILGMNNFTGTSAFTTYVKFSYVDGYLDLKPQSVIPPASIGRIFFSGSPLFRLIYFSGNTSNDLVVI